MLGRSSTCSWTTASAQLQTPTPAATPRAAGLRARLAVAAALALLQNKKLRRLPVPEPGDERAGELAPLEALVLRCQMLRSLR